MARSWCNACQRTVDPCGTDHSPLCPTRLGDPECPLVCPYCDRRGYHERWCSLATPADHDPRDETAGHPLAETVVLRQLVEWVALGVWHWLFFNDRPRFCAIEALGAPVLAMGPPPDPTVKAATPDDVLREREDRAQELLDGTPESVLLIVYKLLYAQGVRITSIDHDLKKAIGREEASGCVGPRCIP